MGDAPEHTCYSDSLAMEAGMEEGLSQTAVVACWYPNLLDTPLPFEDAARISCITDADGRCTVNVLPAPSSDEATAALRILYERRRRISEEMRNLYEARK